MRAALLIAMLCSLVLMGNSALADEQSDRQAAKAAFAQGGALYESEDYAGALAAFRKAHAIRAHDKVRIPIAACLEKLERLREAVEELDEVVASDQVTDAQRRNAKRALRRLTPKLGILKVAGEPAGAAVMIDGAPRCELPCRTLVDSGERVVVVRSGQRERNERLSFEPGQQHTIEVSLTPSAPAPPPPSRPPPDVDKPVEPEIADQGPNEPLIAGGVLLGVGAAAAIAGGIIGGTVLSDASEAESDDNLCGSDKLCEEEGLALISKAEDKALAANLLIGIGAGVAAAGAVSLIVGALSEAEPAQTSTLHVGMGADGAFVVWRARF